MARIARVVVPGVAHHVTQRGNGRLRVFSSNADYRLYVSLLRESCKRYGVEIWAYCLMPDRVRLIAVPDDGDGLARAFGEAHRRYARTVNDRRGRRRSVWRGRFSSYPLDEAYLPAAARDVETSPVRARMAARPWDYRWSSARAHVRGKNDDLVRARPLLKITRDWRRFLGEKVSRGEVEALRRHGGSGKPLGTAAFVARIEKLVGRRLAPKKRGPKPQRRGRKTA